MGPFSSSLYQNLAITRQPGHSSIKMLRSQFQFESIRIIKDLLKLMLLINDI